MCRASTARMRFVTSRILWHVGFAFSAQSARAANELTKNAMTVLHSVAVATFKCFWSITRKSNARRTQHTGVLSDARAARSCASALMTKNVWGTTSVKILEFRCDRMTNVKGLQHTRSACRFLLNNVHVVYVKIIRKYVTKIIHV